MSVTSRGYPALNLVLSILLSFAYCIIQPHLFCSLYNVFDSPMSRYYDCRDYVTVLIKNAKSYHVLPYPVSKYMLCLLFPTSLYVTDVCHPLKYTLDH
jgi:hypothetical protein